MGALAHPALWLMLAALAVFAATQALHGGVLMRLGSCVFLLSVPGYQALTVLKPRLRRWTRALPTDARAKLARAGPLELLPFLCAVLVSVALHALGLLGAGGIDSLSVGLSLAALAVLLLSLWFQLHWLWVLVRFLFPYLTWGGPEHEEGCAYVDEESGKPLIALSIDDVPCTFEKFGASEIEACLDLLDKHGAKATLFVMSQELPKHDKHKGVSAVLSKAVSRGYELGNHDLLDVKTVLKNRADFTAALRECDERIKELVEQGGDSWQGWQAFAGGAGSSSSVPKKESRESWQEGEAVPGSGAGTDVAILTKENRYRDPLALARQGRPIKWFRPGGGFFKEEQVSIAADHGYSTVLGNCFPMDTHMPRSHNEWYLRFRARPGKIIIIHDRPKLRATLEALLPDLCAQYKVVTLSTLFQAAAKAKHRADSKQEPRKSR